MHRDDLLIAEKTTQGISRSDAEKQRKSIVIMSRVVLSLNLPPMNGI